MLKILSVPKWVAGHQNECLGNANAFSRSKNPKLGADNPFWEPKWVVRHANVCLGDANGISASRNPKCVLTIHFGYPSGLGDTQISV